MALGLILFSAPELYASNVRTLTVNNQAMAPIYLKIGKSTVLRFAEKPKKVVVGNQNYYGLEFIENDVAIQPLGSFGTNLFVYTENHTYGFLLTPGERYDDLVFVRWKFQQASGPERPALPVAKVASPKTVFMVGPALKIAVVKVEGPSTFGLHIIDCAIENVGKSDADLSSLSLKATRKGQSLESQTVAIEADKLRSHEKTKARIVLKLGGKDDLSIEGKWQGFSGKGVVARRFL